MKKTALLIAISMFMLNPVSGAVVEVSNSSAMSGESSYSHINLSGFDNFGVADIDLYYDPGVVNVTSASLGFSGYGGSLTPNINNNIGKATFLVMVSDIPGPNSPLTLLNVSLKAVGQEGNSNALSLVISALSNTDGISPADLAVNNGTFRVLPAIQKDTTPPTWSPIPTNQVLELGTTFSYDVNAVDQQTITYSVNDTFRFAINSITGLITNSTILTNGSYGLIITATDASGNANSAIIKVTVQDTTPPGSVRNLVNSSYAPNYINWTWTDPDDSDFAKVMVYIDGVFKTNVTKGKQFYFASGLKAATTHTIVTRTVDTAGNINLTSSNHTSPTSITKRRNHKKNSQYVRLRY